MLGESCGLGQGGFGFVAGPGEIKGEQVVFESGNAIEPPGCVGDGLDELLLGCAFGLVLVEERQRVAFVSFEIFGWKDDGVTSESIGVGR